MTIHIFIYYVYITPDIWQQVSKVLSTKSLESLQQNEVLPVERDGHLPLDPMATWRARGGVLVNKVGEVPHDMTPVKQENTCL